jgi:hypothetical protein
MPARETLVQRQRALLAAVKGREEDTGRFDAPELALLRDTLLWWRRLTISQSCPFTATLLRVKQRFEGAIESYVRDTPGADSIEMQRDLFLAYAARDRDPLCAAVAATEAALLTRVGNPAGPARTILWPRDPDPVFAALLRGEAPPAAPRQAFVLTVNHVDGETLEWHQATPDPIENEL